MEPTFSFTIPSIEDDTKLDCRIYHPDSFISTLSTRQEVRAAVVAHPYAPLGGCYDDPVVLSVSQRLLQDGCVVCTFNFRGAGESEGSTSWSAKGEMQDYMTVIGFIVHYIRGVKAFGESSRDQQNTQLLLAGYSYGSLILTRLPPVMSILERFETAALGTTPAEVILRARRLASETQQMAVDLELQQLSRGRDINNAHKSPTTGRSRARSSVTIGGEETDKSARRLSRGSRESRRGLEFVKKGVEVPHRIVMHMRRRSSSKSADDSSQTARDHEARNDLEICYLLISPLLPPLSHALVPPAHMTQLFFQHSADSDPSTGFGSLQHNTLAVWGSADGFTSSKKLNHWIQKLGRDDVVQAITVEGAGHFWRESGVMKQLLTHISSWNRKTGSQRNSLNLNLSNDRHHIA